MLSLRVGSASICNTSTLTVAERSATERPSDTVFRCVLTCCRCAVFECGSRSATESLRGIEHEFPRIRSTSTVEVVSRSATRRLRRHCGMERTRQRPDPGRGAGERDCEPPQPHRPILRPLRVWGKNVGRQRHDAGCTTVPGPARRVGVCEIYYRVVGIIIHSVLEQNSCCTFRLKSQWGIPFFFFLLGLVPIDFGGKVPHILGEKPPNFGGKASP